MKHGLTHTAEWKVWARMRRRCYSPKYHCYDRYGGRGITICERWNEFNNFLADVGQRPGPDFSIERIDNDGNYEPSNCKWATKLEQCRNKSNTYTDEEDRIVRDAVARGLNFKQAAELIGKSYSSVSMRSFRIGLKSGFRPRGPAVSSPDRTTETENTND